MLFLGSEVNLNMFLPPRTKRYSIMAFCSAECTNEVLVEHLLDVYDNHYPLPVCLTVLLTSGVLEHKWRVGLPG